MEYIYFFSVWPDETWNFDRAVFTLFEMLTTRVEMRFKQEEFEAFRSRLPHHGLTLREVERWQYREPETVL